MGIGEDAVRIDGWSALHTIRRQDGGGRCLVIISKVCYSIHIASSVCQNTSFPDAIAKQAA